jgi:pyruvate,orthophosphate dikinase
MQVVNHQWVYNFGADITDGHADMKNLLGGKGANLAEMAHLGLPVPPGFTISTEACTYYYSHHQTYPDSLKDQVSHALKKIEKFLGARFDDPLNPLLLSVRSGARASMPGMMDTVLNLGLNDITVEGLAQKSGDRRFAFDSYRRFIQMYSDVVLGVDHYHFEDILERHKEDKNISLDTDLEASDLEKIVQSYKEIVKTELGKEFPQSAPDQLWGAIGAVFSSWMNNRATIYRKLHDIPVEWGTAVNIQAMVFGNMGEDCATGVAFTRDPSTGANIFYGEYLINAQGEDVVAGIRTPQYLTKAARLQAQSNKPSMEESLPQVFSELVKVRDILENHFKDMQDIEFTVQQSKLWMLQTRNGKRTIPAALKIAVDMTNEGLIDKKTAISRIDPAALDQILHPTLDPNASRDILTTGLPASPGAASGKVVFTAEDAEIWSSRGEAVILVRTETSPEDIGGMHVSQGIATARGGMTSHAAVVARGMGRPCVSGAGDLSIDLVNKTITIKKRVIKEGDIITLDGTTGTIMAGSVPTLKPQLTGDFATLMSWCDSIRTLKVRANAETPADAEAAKSFGAEGIGLCRTEHMFFEPDRIIAVREMIMAPNEKGRKIALEKLLPFQRKDFENLFTVMSGYPVTIRLLDPPLHEFLPTTEQDIQDVAAASGLSVESLRKRNSQLHENNPMLGHRGCRLGISYPEIYAMQARAIFEAALTISKKTGTSIIPEIMIPLVATKKELDLMKSVIDQEAQTVFKEMKQNLTYLVGTMIELPRAALMAGQIAETAEFFSFGTNDLTQTTLGMSRDDSGSFLEIYRTKGIYPQDPFATIDQEGVGELVKIASERGRKTNQSLKLGICGEHGGDPASIAFFQKVGLDYISCSPYRVPVARLAAAQAAL